MSVDIVNALPACATTRASMQNKAVAATPSDPTAFSSLMTTDVLPDSLTMTPNSNGVNSVNLNHFSVDMNMSWGTFLESLENADAPVSSSFIDSPKINSPEKFNGELTIPGFLKNIQTDIFVEDFMHAGTENIDTEIVAAKTPRTSNKTPTVKKPPQPQVMNYIAPNRTTPFVSVDQEKPSMEKQRQDLPQDPTALIEVNFSAKNLNNTAVVPPEFSSVEQGVETALPTFVEVKTSAEESDEKTFKNNTLDIQMAVFSPTTLQESCQKIDPISPQFLSQTSPQGQNLPLFPPVLNLDTQKTSFPNEVSMDYQSNIHSRVQLDSSAPVIIESIAAPLVFTKPTVDLNYHGEFGWQPEMGESVSTTKNIAVKEGEMKTETTAKIIEISSENTQEISEGNNQNAEIRGLDGAKPFEKTTDAISTKTEAPLVNHETIIKNIREQVPAQMPRQIATGETHLKIQLHPEELGHVDIRVDIAKNGAAKIMMVAENAIVRDVLAQYRQDITQIFEQPGLSLDAGSLNFSMRQDQQSAEKEQQSSRFSSSTEASFESTELTQHLQRNSSSHATGMIDINA